MSIDRNTTDPADEDYVPISAMCVQVGQRSTRLAETGHVTRQIVTVKLELSDGQVVTEAWTPSTNIDTLRTHLSTTFQLPKNVLQINCNGDSVQDHVTLRQLGGQPNGFVTLRVSSSNPLMYPVQARPTKDVPPVPDVITVRVRRNNGKREDVIVEIENQTGNGVFLGGLRYKENGTELLHAQTQTYYSISPDNHLQIIEDSGPRKADIQIATFNHSETQTSTSTACQVKPYHFNMTAPHSLLRTPRVYLNAEDSHKAAKLIQRNVRKWMEDHKQEKKTGEDYCPSVAESETIEKLTAQMDSWKTSPSPQPSVRNSPSSTKAIMDIERVRNTRSSAAKDKLIQHILHKVSEPKTWTCSTGHTIEVDTKETLRSRQITETYEALCKTPRTPEERAEILHQLKKTLSGESGAVVKEILLLADRELDLIARGFPQNLNGLRSRLRALIRRYVNLLLATRTV